MCRFLSALVLRSGDIICDPEHTDSHEHLIEAHGLSDRGLDAFVRVEFIPVDQNFVDVSSYKLVVDEPGRPDWFESALEERIIESLRDRVRRMIVEDERRLLLGGCWILGPHAVVRVVVNARIYCMVGDSQVGELRGNSQVGVLWENSQVGVLRENSQVGELRENSQVGELWENSKVGVLWENSKVGVLWGNSQVGELRGNSQVGVLWEDSQVGVDYRASAQSKEGAACTE